MLMTIPSELNAKFDTSANGKKHNLINISSSAAGSLKGADKSLKKI
jgi:hypothetical protein